MLFDRMITREPIHKGWSGDQKYRITDDLGNAYLLRISSIERYEKKQTQFRRMEQAAALDIPMCLPVEFGRCEEGVYSIQTWIEGVDAEETIPTLPFHQQYAYGVDAGKILARLHTIPAPGDIPAWEERFNKKINRKIAMYQGCPLKYDHGEAFLAYLAENRHLLSSRPQSYQHGDYHIGNMMIDENGTLTIIDFDRDDCGDPWEEFNRIVWCAQCAPHFATGMVDGYFGSEVPKAFWDLLALYICSNTLSSLPWAISFGEQEIQTMRKQAKEVLAWYSGMTCTVPTWYLAEDKHRF